MCRPHVAHEAAASAEGRLLEARVAVAYATTSRRDVAVDVGTVLILNPQP